MAAGAAVADQLAVELVDLELGPPLAEVTVNAPLKLRNRLCRLAVEIGQRELPRGPGVLFRSGVLPFGGAGGEPVVPRQGLANATMDA